MFGRGAQYQLASTTFQREEGRNGGGAQDMIMHGQAPGHAYGVEAGRVVGGLDPALHRVHAGIKVVGPDPEEAEAQRGNQQR